MRLTAEQLEGVVSFLEGSCSSLDDALRGFGLDESSLDGDDRAAIDEEIFCCDGCGWWFPSDEDSSYDGEPLCEDCARDEEEERR